MVASGKDVAIVVGVIGIIVALIFAGRQAFGAISGIKLPEFTLPTFELPTFELPTLPNIFGVGEGDPEQFFETGPGGARSARGDIAEEQEAAIVLENLNVQSEIPGQQFFGGGVSFIGGSVTETPIEFLTLNQIIEMGLASSASEAASLRAEEIGLDGGFIPEGFFEQSLQGLPEGVDAPLFGGITGDPQFLGLTPEQISLMLTGGSISNF